MEAALLVLKQCYQVISQILDIKIVQWALLGLLIFIGIKFWYLKYDNAMLRSTNSDITSALYIQNEKVKELGSKTEEFKENYEQAVSRSTKIAIEGQKTLQELMKQQFVGSCEDKVRQANDLVKGALK